MRWRALYLLLGAGSAAAQSPPVGIIDFYGARTVAIADLRRALGVTEGDSLTIPGAELERRLEAVPGVARASVDAVCCEEGTSILYIGIEERGSAPAVFRAPPSSSVRLHADIVTAGEALDRALSAAVRRGDIGEDDAQGHALMHDTAARAIQGRFITFAVRHRPHLRQVLRESSDSSHRALAAQVIAYSPNKPRVVDDLVYAAGDPSSEVRNNAVRALAIIAGYARAHPDQLIVVPAEPFLGLLNSAIWTDRNKGSFAVMNLTEGRDPALLARLKADALPSLIDMARWKSPGHALAAVIVLGRIGGLSDAETFQAFERGDREAVIRAAGR